MYNPHAALRFEWDPVKARRNRLKHRVSFEEAATAFGDEEGLLMDDPDHSIAEERFLLLGLSSALRLLVVVHCIVEPEGVIRLISARKATPSEARTYFDRR